MSQKLTENKKNKEPIDSLFIVIKLAHFHFITHLNSL